jgi:serine/threonine protein kinase
MLSLSICLLLQPQRGTLDELYCHQYPIDNGKENVLYILHQHLCHEANNDVIQSLLEEVHNISPPLAGQRLLKLMCPQLFDLGLYNNGRDWKKLAVGAYGVVYECSTNVKDPSSVAIKKMDLPVDVYDRCVLHDIFTEITCLEEFRLEKCVTDLYDYGVDRSSYYIVMKKYARSLGEWRRQQGDSIQVFQQNLSLYVSIYNQVLKALQTIHAHKVTHYDIKCDNVLIDFVGDQDQGDLRNMTEDDFQITFGDFGECRIFSDDKDEFCTRNRGTDSIKSPEMLQLAINTRKDHDKYDRRKQVGTNRLSDIWSAGCLFYELLTGEFLLYDPDFSYFFVKVVKPTSELFSEEKLKKIEHNQYIKDFLKFILIRDQRLRPTIDKVIKRFQHIHAILVGSSSYNDRHPTGLAAITAAEQI